VSILCFVKYSKEQSELRPNDGGRKPGSIGAYVKWPVLKRKALFEQRMHARVAPEPAVEIETSVEPPAQGVVVREQRQSADAGHP
jgi:hypothetical protein